MRPGRPAFAKTDWFRAFVTNCIPYREPARRADHFATRGRRMGYAFFVYLYWARLEFFIRSSSGPDPTLKLALDT